MLHNLNGLTTKEAEKLLQKHGLNQLRQSKKKSYFISFLEQLNNPLILMLLSAVVVSIFLKEYIDGIFILLIVILNSIFGIYQEFKAESSIKKLQSLSLSKVRVIRDGNEMEIDSTFLVPGDIIYLEEGIKIPADALLLTSTHLEVNESMLTGESLPVYKTEKDGKKSSIYMGTIVTQGKGYAKIINTGMKTKLGQIANTLQLITEEETPLQIKLKDLSKILGIIGISASIIVFLLSFIRDKTLFESLILAISLAVAAVPEGLPAVMTITLSIGLERMAKKKAIIRKLNAIETLGSLTMIVTDKTGTLTQNFMRVKKIWCDNKDLDINKKDFSITRTFDHVLLNSILCSTANLIQEVKTNKYDYIGDPTEGALLLMANELKYNIREIRDEWDLIEEKPFNSDTKKMSVYIKNKTFSRIYSKGSPESIINNCEFILSNNKTIPLLPSDKIRIKEEFEKYAQEGLRVIAFSYKENGQHNKITKESGQIFLGFIGINDPPREEVLHAVKMAKQAGLKIAIITGDNPLTAEVIGIETGIVKKGDYILTGEELSKYSDEEILELLPKVKIFARATPHDKYRLVQLYQKLGHIVAVTGDGVNDALALKQAHVGIAMGLVGTDVARDTADMILADDNFSTIINAIEEGRNIFRNIQRTIIYLLTCNISEVISVLLSVMIGLPAIVTPLQILYINLVTDGIPALSFAFAPKQSNLMREKPLRKLSIFGHSDIKYISLLGAFGAFLTLSAFFIGKNISPNNISLARTMSFTTLTLMQSFILLDLWRTMHQFKIESIYQIIKNPVFLIGFFIPFIFQPILIYNPFMQLVFKTHPLSLTSFSISIALSFFILIPIFGKLILNKIKTSF